MSTTELTVIPAQAGIQIVHLIEFQGRQSYELDSGLRRNDGLLGRRAGSRQGFL